MLVDDLDSTEFINYLKEYKTFEDINKKYRMTKEQLKCFIIALSHDNIIEINNGKYKIKRR